MEEWNSVQAERTLYLNWWWNIWRRWAFQKNGRITWKHILVYFSVFQSQVLLQEKQAGVLLELINSARILGNYNSEEYYFLESIFIHPDLNCCPDDLVRTEYRSCFNRIFPLLKAEPLPIHSIYVPKWWQLIHHTSLANMEA